MQRKYDESLINQSLTFVDITKPNSETIPPTPNVNPINNVMQQAMQQLTPISIVLTTYDDNEVLFARLDKESYYDIVRPSLNTDLELRVPKIYLQDIIEIDKAITLIMQRYSHIESLKDLKNQLELYPIGIPEVVLETIFIFLDVNETINNFKYTTGPMFALYHAIRNYILLGKAKMENKIDRKKSVKFLF